MIYTTNWIERFNKSCRRTLKIRGAFPNEESVLALITSVAIDKSGKTYNYPIYNLKLLFLVFDTTTNSVQVLLYLEND